MRLVELAAGRVVEHRLRAPARSPARRAAMAGSARSARQAAASAVDPVELVRISAWRAGLVRIASRWSARPRTALGVVREIRLGCGEHEAAHAGLLVDQRGAQLSTPVRIGPIVVEQAVELAAVGHGRRRRRRPRGRSSTAAAEQAQAVTRRRSVHGLSGLGRGHRGRRPRRGEQQHRHVVGERPAVGLLGPGDEPARPGRRGHARPCGLVMRRAARPRPGAVALAGTALDQPVGVHEQRPVVAVEVGPGRRALRASKTPSTGPKCGRHRDGLAVGEQQRRRVPGQPYGRLAGGAGRP